MTYFLQDYRYYDDLVTIDNKLNIDLIVLGELERNDDVYKIKGYLQYSELKKYCDAVVNGRSNGQIPVIRNETFERIIQKYEGQFFTRVKLSRKDSRIYRDLPAIQRHIKIIRAKNLEIKNTKFIKTRILNGPHDTISAHIIRGLDIEPVSIGSERLSAVVGYADGRPNKII